MKTETKASSATVLRKWLNDNYLIEDQAKLRKSTLRELFQAVRHYDGDPIEILNSYYNDGSFPKEDNSMKSYIVTATVTVVVEATNESEAIEKADGEFESRDLCTEMPWLAQRYDPEATEDRHEWLFDQPTDDELWSQC